MKMIDSLQQSNGLQRFLTHGFIVSLLLLALSLFMHPATARADAPVLTFTAIPDQDQQKLAQRFGSIADYLTETLGITVKYIPVKSYAAAVTAFRNNQVQLAWFGGLAGVRARSLVPGSMAIAQGVEDNQFKSYFIANTSTGLTANTAFPENISGMTFTFGSKGSTSGRLMPEFYIRQYSEQSPQQLFKRVGFSGDHNRTIALVEAGSYQLGAVNYKVWEEAVAKGKVDTDKVSVIWETPNYTDYQWTIRGDLDSRFGAGTTQNLTAALLNIRDPKLLAAFPRSGFIAASNDDYQAIAETAVELGLLRQ